MYIYILYTYLKSKHQLNRGPPCDNAMTSMVYKKEVQYCQQHHESCTTRAHTQNKKDTIKYEENNKVR